MPPGSQPETEHRERESWQRGGGSGSTPEHGATARARMTHALRIAAPRPALATWMNPSARTRASPQRTEMPRDQSKTVDQDERSNAERRALFVGLWPPTLRLVGDSLGRHERRR
jgi:hypothetical protein